MDKNFHFVIQLFSNQFLVLGSVGALLTSMIVSEPLIVTGSLISYCNNDDDDDYDFGDEADDGGHGHYDDDDLLTSVVVS